MDRVLQVRGLLEAGLPTRIIQQILPCLTTPGVLVCQEDDTPGLIAALEQERDRMTQRVEFLTRNRDAIADYLAALRRPARHLVPRPDSPGPCPRRSTGRTLAARSSRIRERPAGAARVWHGQLAA